MPPARPLTYREVARKPSAARFAEVSQRGSQVRFARDSENGVRIAIVPRHREVAVGTLRSIVRQAGLSRDEFDRL